MLNKIGGVSVCGLLSLAVVAAALGSEVVHIGDSSNSRYEAYKAVAFSEAKSVSVAQLDGSRRLGIERIFSRSFHGFRRISDWKQLDPKEADKIAKPLREQIDRRVAAFASAGDGEVIELSSFCIPRPGFAVRIETEQGRREFLICLECGEADVLGRHTKGLEFSLETEVTSTLKGVYQAAFAK